MSLTNLPQWVQARLRLFPVSAKIVTDPAGQFLTLDGHNLSSLAEAYGTPLYLYDQTTLDHNLAQYQAALAQHYPATHQLTYAGKAFLCLAMAQWAVQKGLVLDCSSAGEIAITAKAGAPRQQILVHGVNKRPADLEAALAFAGIIVVDHLHELAWLVSRYQQAAPNERTTLPKLWLRLRPNANADTHAYTQTSSQDSKFGLSPGEILLAVQTCLSNQLPLTGLHFHLGSKFQDPTPVENAIQEALDVLATLRAQTGWIPEVFSPGGGWETPYHEEELPHAPLQDYVAHLCEALCLGCSTRHLPLPRLQLEPGRSLIAQAGIALYRVGAVKNSAQRRWVLLDGGLGDNPRPALYQARYTALPATALGRPLAGTAWVGGPFCESGDVLTRDLPLPAIQPGEFLAVPVSGAYQLSMSSNYNGAYRPAVLWLAGGQVHLIQRRETSEDLLRRDFPLPG